MYKFILYCWSTTLLFILCILQFGCGNGTSSTSNSSAGNLPDLVKLGTISVIPSFTNTSPVARISVDNNSNDNVILVSTTIQADGILLNGQQLSEFVNVSSCVNLMASTSCDILITPHKLSGSFVITMIYANQSGGKYTTSQLVNYSSYVTANNGFAYLPPDDLPNLAGTHTLSIPLILAENYSALSAQIQQLPGATTNIICPDYSYTAGTLCHIIVKYTGNSLSRQNSSLTNSQPQLIVTGNVTNDSSRQNNSVITLSTISSNAGHLITSGLNTIINPTSSSTPTITLFNNGEGQVSDITINGTTPITINQTGGCGSTLAANNSCTFTISASSATASGQGQVLISYSNGVGETKNLSFNVYYTIAASSPNLTAIANNWLINTTVSTINYQGVYLINGGDTALDNLQFGSVSNITGMTYGGNGQTCVNGQSLAPGGSCVMVVSYAPTGVVAIGSSMNVAVAANYSSQTGSSLSYTTNTNIQYSANTAATGTFVATGDYGAITSSVTTPAGAWSVQNNTPFTAAATTIARMVNNGTLQVAGTGGTAAGAGFIYEGNKGMIWQSASGGTNAPPTGAVNDMITGLTYDSTNGYLVSNNAAAANLYSTSIITGITPTWSPVFSAAFANQPFNLFNFGTSLAYLSPENTATTSKQLDVSTSPKTSWTAVNTTGVARAYIGAIYDGVRYCVLSSTRFISCAASAGFTTGSTWTQNATTIFTAGTANMLANNGTSTYAAIVSVSPFVVFLSSPANPATAGTWTSAATPPSAALTWITYGNGQYVGVSAASPGLIWTSPDGNIWTQQTSGTASNPINEPYGFAYFDGTSYWASGTRVLQVSQDGVNWSNAGISDLTYTYVGGVINYLAAGTVGAIASSSNLTTWTSINSSTTNKLNAIKCFNSNNCYAVGMNGTILFSNDGAGASWSAQNSTTTNGLNSVACGYSNCVVVGNGGTVLTQSNASTNWVAASSGTAQNLNSVVFFSQYSRYIAVGNGGVILTSSDGVSWTTATSGVVTNLNSVACAYSNVGCMAVGASGTVITSPSGIFWTAKATATAASNAVTFYNGYWILSQATGVKYSLDNTTITWNAVATGITEIAAMNMNAILAY